jgi:hypothetical protein
MGPVIESSLGTERIWKSSDHQPTALGLQALSHWCPAGDCILNGLSGLVTSCGPEWWLSVSPLGH